MDAHPCGSLSEKGLDLNMAKNRLAAVFLLLGTAIGCSSNGGSGGDSRGAGGADGGGADDDGGRNLAGPSTFLEVSSVAKMIYDATEAGEDVAPHIEAVLSAFGVPMLQSSDEKGALARVNAGLPFVTSRVVEEMASAYAQGRLIDAEGFTEGLAEQGVGLAYPYNMQGSGLDLSLLGSLLYSFTVAGESMPDVPLSEGTVLPSLVRELGQERARRVQPAEVDPTWGDGRLDPLQFTLLSFSIFAKPANATQKAKSGLSRTLRADVGADFIKDKIKDAIKDKVEGDLTSAVQDIVEVPLDKKDAAKVSVCGSLILYGHKVSVTNTPNLLWHAPKTPNLTKVEMTLTFEDDYYDNWARAVLGSAVTDLTGCAFPRKGPIEGKSVTWDVSSGLKGHGSYDVAGTTTNEEGKVLASWRTITDDYPKACQVLENQRDAVGATEAVVSGLLSGWSTVETIVTFLNPNTGTQGNAPLTVLYYEVTVDDTCHTE